MKQIKKSTFIYWRRKGDKTFTKSWLHDIIETDKGNLLEVSCGYSTIFILQKEVEILK